MSRNLSLAYFTVIKFCAAEADVMQFHIRTLSVACSCLIDVV